MREKLQQMFIGRQGMDELSKTLFWAGTIAIALGALLPLWGGLRSMLLTLGIMLIVLAFVRAFSRNLPQREAENLLLGKKSHRAKQVYFDLVNNYRFFIPLHTVLEQMRELADYFEHGIGTLLRFNDPGVAIEIYREIVKCQPGGEQSLNDRLVLGRKLEADGQREEAVKV